jgi:Cupin domain
MQHTVRRIITGNNDAGHSIVIADGAPPFVADMGEGEPDVSMIWASDAVPTVAHDGSDPTLALTLDTVFPSPGGCRLMIVRHPPGAGTRVGDAAGSDAGDVHFDARGMHSTDTVDYIIMISGTLHMELDNGVEVALGAGDVLIQNGTRHGWRNHGDTDAVVAVVLVGATRV